MATEVYHIRPPSASRNGGVREIFNAHGSFISIMLNMFCRSGTKNVIRKAGEVFNKNFLEAVALS